MSASSFQAAIADWAMALLKGEIPAAPVKARVRKPPANALEAPAHPHLPEVAERFGLSAAEQGLVLLAFAVERSFDVAQEVRSQSGQARLTVRLLRKVLGPGVDELLLLDHPLRAHGLVTLEALPGGLPAAHMEIDLGLGLAQRLLGSQVTPDMLGPGIAWVARSATGRDLPAPLVGLVRDVMVDVRARWVAINGAHPGDAEAVATALAKRVNRSVALVDGVAVSGLDPRSGWDLLAAVRREADLHDAPMVVDAAGSIPGVWRAFAGRPAPGGTLPTPIVLLDSGSVPAGRPHCGFSVHEVTFSQVPAKPAPPPEPATAPQAGTTQPTPVDDGFETVRRQAAMDAARALGRVIDVPRARPHSGPIVARTSENQPSPAPTPPPAAPPPAVQEKPPVKEESPQVEAKPAAPKSKQKAEGKSKGKAKEALATPPAEEKAAKTAPPTPPPAEPNPPATPVELASEPDPSEALPFVSVPEEATIRDLVRLVGEVKNPLQRADLIQRLVDFHQKDVHVIALLRSYTKADHPVVRAAAENGMIVFFGPNWSQQRSIPKPVQPPRSDDGDRGPPGGM